MPPTLAAEILTIATIRKSRGRRPTQFLFNERQRIFALRPCRCIDVSMYSIQPGSAYTPNNYAGTKFTTDPTYTETDATLAAYSTYTTCP
jgi:hypothetical protein